MAPWVACRHALRGWEGPGLPTFQRDKGLVPEALLDVLPASEIAAVGWRSFLLVSLDRSAEGNSVAPLPSPGTPAPSTADSGPEDGSDWLVAGEPWQGDNPKLTIAAAWHEVVRLWAACRGETGYRPLARSGGVWRSAAWVVDAFSALASMHAAMNEAEQKLRGQR